MPADALSLLQADNIVLDLNMPGVEGVSFIKTIASLNPKPQLLIASGYDNSIIELARSADELYDQAQTIVLQNHGLLRASATKYAHHSTPLLV